MTVTSFSQRDPRWLADPLGTSELTIGQAGCLITAMASLLVDCGVATDPARLNRQLIQSWGYVDDNLFVFSAVDGLGVRFREWVECATVAAPVAHLTEVLAAGWGVVALVDAQPGGKVNPHWVRVLGLAEQAQIMDPWQLPGQELGAMSRYLARGWTPARGIFAAAIYERLATRRAYAWQVTDDTAQRAVCLWQPENG